jgi:hypothetical protein
MSSLRGKSTRRKSTPVREDGIEIPEELISQNRKIDLCIDIMYVNECGFMTTIDRTIQFRSALPIENRTHEEYYCVLDMVLRLYNSAGFHIKTIHCNGEFRAMMDKVKDDLGVCMKTPWIMYQRQRETTELSRNGYGRHIIDCHIKHY